MTFATLEIDPSIMREGNEDYLPSGTFDNTKIKNLYKTIAKTELKQDLCTKQRLLISNTIDMATLDDIVNDYQTNLQLALMYKQLYWFYFNKNEGDGSVTNDRMKMYKAMYENKKNEFTGYVTYKVPTATTVNVRR